MKFKIILLSLLCLNVAGIYAQEPAATPQPQPVATPAPQPEAQVTISISEYDRLRDAEKMVDALTKRYEARLDSLQKISEINRGQYEKEIAAKNEEIKKYQEEYILLVSNFLYVPYDQYSIDHIVKPAYEMVKGTELAKKHKNRFVLILNYKRDLQELIAFCKEKETDIRTINPGKMKEDCAQIKGMFDGMTVVKNYKNYPDYKETYIGKIIAKIDNVLTTATGTDKKQVTSAFENCREELEDLLKQAQ